MKKSIWSLSAGTVLGLAISSMTLPGVAIAQEVNLPPPTTCGLTGNCLVFDDFTVYSLALLQDLYGKSSSYDFVYKPNESLINVISSSGSSTQLQGSGTAIDGAFRAMEGSSGTGMDNMLYLMSGTSITTATETIPSDPLGGPGAKDNSTTYPVLNSDTFTLQPRLSESQFDNNLGCYADMNTSGCIQSWDTTVAALLGTLKGSELFFMFANNETGDTGTLEGQDLLAWGRVTLYNADGTSISFTLSGNDSLPFQGQSQTADLDDILPTAGDKWAYVHSEICVKDSDGTVFLGACIDNPNLGDDKWHTVNQSLGSDQAGFAITSDALNDALYSNLWTYMAVDIRFSHLNNGGDDVWILAGQPYRVPEPTSAALLGLGLLSLVALRRRNSRRN